MIAVCADVTAFTTALNPVLIAPDFTVTLLGTVTAELLLVRVTFVLVLVFALRYTEQASVAGAL
jgi:hypothetical protein